MADNLLLPVCLSRILDSNGDPVSGAKINVYDAGTTTAKNVFTDNGLTVAAANPIVADSGGWVDARFIGTGDYKLVITDSADVTIKTADNLTGALDTSNFDNDTAIPTMPVITKSANYTVVADDRGKLILADSTGGTFTVTLPDAGAVGDNFLINIKHTGTANNVTVGVTGGDTIDGASSFTLDNQYEAATFVSDGANWHVVSDGQITVETIPTGAFVPYGNATAPTGWVNCDGSAISRTDFADLFAVVFTTFGTGDGSTTFNVPDMGGRVPAGLEASETRLTSAGSGINGGTLGASGGSETHTLIQGEITSHDHSNGSLSAASAGSHNHNIPARDFSTGGSSDGSRISEANGAGGTDTFTSMDNDGAHTHNITGSTSTTGSSNAHQNTQPTLIANYIIKT